MFRFCVVFCGEYEELCHGFQAINPLIAKKMQEDRGREYMNARRVAKEYEAVTKGLNKNAPSIPPTNAPEEVKQVGGETWKGKSCFAEWCRSIQLILP